MWENFEDGSQMTVISIIWVVECPPVVNDFCIIKNISFLIQWYKLELFLINYIFHSHYKLKKVKTDIMLSKDSVYQLTESYSFFFFYFHFYFQILDCKHINHYESYRVHYFPLDASLPGKKRCLLLNRAVITGHRCFSFRSMDST